MAQEMKTEDKVNAATGTTAGGSNDEVTTQGAQQPTTQSTSDKGVEKTEKKSDNKDSNTGGKAEQESDSNNPVGDWVVDTVGLKQYKEAFLEFEYENLKSIIKIDRETFSQDIKSLMERVDTKKIPAHRGRLTKFMQCYDDLDAQYGKNKQNGTSTWLSLFVFLFSFL